MDFFLPTFGDWSDEELERHKEQLPDMRSADQKPRNHCRAMAMVTFRQS